MAINRPIPKKSQSKSWITDQRLDELREIDQLFGSQCGKIQKIAYKIGALAKDQNKRLYNHMYKLNHSLCSFTAKEHDKSLSKFIVRGELFYMLLRHANKAMLIADGLKDNDEITEWCQTLIDEISTYLLNDKEGSN